MTVAINKNFIVKNGIEVADFLIYTDTINSNVGLGTSVPEAFLHVAGNVFVGDGIKVTGVTTTTTKLDVGVGGTVLTVDSTLGDENGKGSVRVGINTQDPTRTLHVIGDTGTHHPGIPGHPGVGYTALYVEGYTHINGLAEFNDKLASSWQFINDNVPYYGLWQDNDVGRLILKGTDANLDNKAINVYRNGSLQGNRVFNVGYDGSVGIASNFTGDGDLKIHFDSTNYQKGFRVINNGGTTLIDVSGTGNNATAVGVYSGDGSGGGTYMVNIKHDGSATFAGTIQSGGNPNAGTARGTSINEYGTVRACQTSGSSTIWEGYTKDTGTTTSSITAAGAADFAGNVTSGSGVLYSRLYPGYLTISNVGNFGQAFGLYNTTTGAYSVKLEMDGAATFAGDLTVNTDALFVDASTKNVGIGETSPSANLIVKQSGSTFAAQSQTVALFQRSSTSGHGAKIAIIAGNAASSDINFGDTDDEDIGLIQYVHTDNSLKFYTNSTQQLLIDSSGSLLIGGTLPSSPNITLTGSTGAATFAGYVTATGYNAEPTDSTHSGLTLKNPDDNAITVDLRASGAAIFNTVLATGGVGNGTQPLFKGTSDAGGTAQVAVINNDGSAVFSGTVDIGTVTSAARLA